MGPKDKDDKRKTGTWGESTRALTEVKMWFRDICASAQEGGRWLEGEGDGGTEPRTGPG